MTDGQKQFSDSLGGDSEKSKVQDSNIGYTLYYLGNYHMDRNCFADDYTWY